METPKFYTYVLIDPCTGIPFYIGKGTGKRLHQHATGSKTNGHLRYRVSEIKDSGLKIIYEKWFESDDEFFCYWMEAYLIDYFGRDTLCNLTHGGEGPPCGDNHPSKDPKFRAMMSSVHKGKVGPVSKFQNGAPGPWLGKKRSLETIAKISAANKGRPSPRKGKRHSPESLQKMSEAHKGQIAWNKGKKSPGMSGPNHHMFGQHHSEESKKKISESKKGKIVGEAHPMFGKTHSAEARAKISEAKKGRPSWNKGKQWTEMSGDNHPLFGKHHSEESRKKMSESAKGKHAGASNGMFGKHMSEETKAKMIATKKALFSAKTLPV